MHLVAIKRDLCERHPFIATSLYKALCKSKDISLARLRYNGALATMIAWSIEQMEIMDSVFGEDPWPYGIERNRKTLEALMRYLVEQSLIAKPLSLESIFVPVQP